VLTRFAPSGRHFHFVPALPPIPVLARRHAPQSGAILVPLRCPFPSVSVHDVKRNTTPHVGDVVGFLRIHRGGPNGNGISGKFDLGTFELVGEAA